MTQQLVFIAKRRDGLGERLRAMLNAIALSKVYHAEFKFFWDDERYNKDGHAIDNKEKIFSSSFIDKHHVELSKTNDCKIIDDFLISKENGCYFCNQNISKHAFKNYPEDYVKYQDELKKAFYEIDFSLLINSAVQEAVQAKPKENCVALHLRAGDLIYGSYKFGFPLIGKAISYPVALKIIEVVASDNNLVLLFGQDTDLIKMLSSKNNVIPAEDLMPSNLDRAETAFFDIALMANCDAIYAGGSGFAVLASMVGNAKYIAPNKLFNNRETVSAIKDSLFSPIPYAGVSKQQISFACKTALAVGVNILSEKEYLDLINIGRKVDPDNVLFDFCYAWNSYMRGDVDKADAIVSSILIDKMEGFRKFEVRNFSSNNRRSVVRKIFDPSILEKYTDKPSTEKIYKMLTGKKTY